ncbi:hypothetical protein F6455_03135 [Proteobacteria bacterium 005FR1]|nr:hypothetical protein [Proteobacteria bacterium 005FR1]
MLEQMPDLLTLLVWGLAASMVMVAIQSGSQHAGLSRLSLPFLFGTYFTANRSRAHIIGFITYLIGGWTFTFIYAGIFVRVGTNWWIGAIVGFIHGLFLLLFMLPAMPHVHPRMASEYDGPTDTRRIEPPGFLGLNYGYRTPLTTLASQIAYGIVLGGFLPS